MLTHAEIVTRLAAALWQSTNSQWTDAIIIADGMTPILKKLSERVPLFTTERHPGDRPIPIRGKYTTDGATRDIILTDWDADDLVRLSQVDGVEHPVDQSPKEYINFTPDPFQGKILTLVLDAIPVADKDVYIYPQRYHILQSAIGTTDTAGVVTAAIGAASLSLTSLGTGTINKYTKLTIAGDSTEYMVTATATITGNAATVTITPPLVVAATAAVVTLALADSTLTPALEEIFIEWVTGSLIKGYAPNQMLGIQIGASPRDYVAIGQDMINNALKDLAGLQRAGKYVNHPRS